MLAWVVIERTYSSRNLHLCALSVSASKNSTAGRGEGDNSLAENTAIVSVVTSSLHYILLPLPRGNSSGSAGGPSPMAPIFGDIPRNGSRSFTFDASKHLLNCPEITTGLS